MSTPTSAVALVAEHGAALVGRWINTEAWGDYPGGRAKVLSVEPLADAPEIVITVWHPEAGEMGIFWCEDVELIR